MTITTNPDTVFAKNKKKEIKRNNGYCGCFNEKTPDTKCKCKEFREMNHSGWCACGLYYLDMDTEEDN